MAQIIRPGQQEPQEMTVEEYRALLDGQQHGRHSRKTKVLLDSLPEDAVVTVVTAEDAEAEAPSRSKFNNRKVLYDGIWFDSGAECERYKGLKLLEAAGEIKCLKVHPVYNLLPKFRDRHGKAQRRTDYEGDFEYEEVTTGLMVTEDTKGFLTEAAALKLKWFAYKFYSVRDLRLVRGDGTPWTPPRRKAKRGKGRGAQQRKGD